MSIDLNILTDKDYIHAIATGSFDMEEVSSHIKDVLSECFNLGKRKITVDFSQLEGEIFPIQRALVGLSIAEVSSQNTDHLREALMIAFVASEDYQTHSAPGVAHLRKSGIDAMITTELEEALAWINN